VRPIHTTLFALLTLSACERPQDPPPVNTGADAARAEPAPVDPKVEGLRRVKAGELVTPAQYEALALTLADCPILTEGLAVDVRCPTRVVIGKARLDPESMGEDAGAARAAIGFRLLAAEHPAPRIWGITLAQNSPEAARRLSQHARGEEHPAVLGRIARALRTQVGKDPEITTLMLELSRHDNRVVRREAASSLASTWAIGEASSLARAEEIVRDADEDLSVRKATCEALGRRGEPSSVPLLAELTRAPPPEPDLYPACFKGLVSMWARPSTTSPPNQAAYEATMERLEARPRTERAPPWGALPALRWVATPKLEVEAPFIDRERVARALATLVADRRYNWLGREAALRTYVDLGADADALEKLRSRLARAAKDEHDERVLRTLDDQIRLLKDKSR
jgi:hypothetical protein